MNHEFTVKSIADLPAFDAAIKQSAIFEPTIWLLYQTSHVKSKEVTALKTILEDTHYRRCGFEEFGLDTVLMLYRWKTLDCQETRPLATFATELLTYDFYGINVDASDNRLLFVEKWRSQSDFAQDDYAIYLSN